MGIRDCGEHSSTAIGLLRLWGVSARFRVLVSRSRDSNLAVCAQSGPQFAPLFLGNPHVGSERDMAIEFWRGCSKFSTINPKSAHYLVVSLNRRTPTYTPKCYNPYYGDSQ